MVSRPSSFPKEASSPNALLPFVEDLKRQWMATIDALIDPLMIVDAQYRVVKVNQAMSRMSGIAVQDIPGKPCHKVFAGRDTPCAECTLKHVFESQLPQSFTLEGIGAERFFEVSSQPIINPDKGVEGVVHVYRDRTEARAMQDRLMQSEKLASIGLLAGGVAHEINNPLGGIIAFSQMLLRELKESDPHREDVQEIESAAQRCKVIVQNLLDFARKRPAGKQANEKVDTGAAARAALRLVSVVSAAKMFDIEDGIIDGAIVDGDRK